MLLSNPVPTATSTQYSLAIDTLRIPPDKDKFDYRNAIWIKPYTTFLVLALFFVTAIILASLLGRIVPLNILSPVSTRWNCIVFTVSAFIYFGALFSIFLGKFECGSRGQRRTMFSLRVVLNLTLSALFLAMPLTGALFRLSTDFGLWVCCGCGGIYVTLAALDQVYLKKWARD